jgi:hypothetical protein
VYVERQIMAYLFVFSGSVYKRCVILGDYNKSLTHFLGNTRT